MKCQVTGCGNTAEGEISISLQPKWGKAVYEGQQREIQTVNVCQMHRQLLESGKVKPKNNPITIEAKGGTVVQNILKPMSSHNYGIAATEAGNLPVQPYNTSADESIIAASASSVVVLAANTARNGATFWNISSAVCYLNLGATSSTSVYTTQINPGGSYILPTPIYTGIISAIWTSAIGSLQITAD